MSEVEKLKARIDQLEDRTRMLADIARGYREEAYDILGMMHTMSILASAHREIETNGRN